MLLKIISKDIKYKDIEHLRHKIGSPNVDDLWRQFTLFPQDVPCSGS
jgi:hypothetical protein